mmetsp:Transcript_5177/g.11256  ORF Transcript_5177/g.11256 Transcript_5177/m.11256 type:complete len:221 (+) Transcript_5177:191-853(+)
MTRAMVPLTQEDGEAMPALPPLPTPDYSARCTEACMGCTVVIVLITIFVGGTFLSSGSGTPSAVSISCMVLICLEAVVALICLAGLMFGDPGVVQRSLETCLPFPQEVADRLANGESMNGMRNIVDGDRTYCVRCFVWRESAPPTSLFGSWVGATAMPHHCSTCQRCILYHDHHCGVFGRCIAGRGMGGTMGYFMTIIAMAVAGFGTCLFSFVVGSVADV